MTINQTKDLLEMLLPIGTVSFGVAFVKAGLIKREGSLFGKAVYFVCSAWFGILCGYLATKFVEYRVAEVIAFFVTFLADQVANKLDRFGLTGLINISNQYIKSVLIKMSSDSNDKKSDTNAK